MVGKDAIVKGGWPYPVCIKKNNTDNCVQCTYGLAQFRTRRFDQRQE